MFYRYLIGILILVSVVSHAQSLAAMRWLEGTWQRQGTKTMSYESWAFVNDSTMHGVAYRVKGNDTTQTENIELTMRNGQVYYIPTVHDQNGGLPITFMLYSDSNECKVFENAAHDFPKKITYCNISQHQLQVVIAGDVHGEEKTIIFNFTRVD